jgi:hypothetical protein
MPRKRRSPRLVTVVFTGAAGADSYSVGEVVLEKGDSIQVPEYEVLKEHWIRLVESGNAEVRAG